MPTKLPLRPVHSGNTHPIAVKQWILDHLALVGEDYYSGMHQAYKKALRRIARERGRKFYYKAPTYLSFIKKISELKAEGLVEMSGREEPTDNPKFRTWAEPPMKKYLRLARR